MAIVYAKELQPGGTVETCRCVNNKLVDAVVSKLILVHANVFVCFTASVIAKAAQIQSSADHNILD